MEIENYCQTLFGCLVAQYFVKTAIPEFHCHVVNFFSFLLCLLKLLLSVATTTQW